MNLTGVTDAKFGWDFWSFVMDWKKVLSWMGWGPDIALEGNHLMAGKKWFGFIV